MIPTLHTGGTGPIKTYPIGIVIPTFNRYDALLTCLSHLELQDWRDFEVIIVDDGSTDSTSDEIERYLQQKKLNLRYFRQENSGPARARNLAISQLRSPICLMIGDDIFASPSLVSEHVEFHMRQPDIRIACLGLTRWSKSGQEVTRFMRWLDEANVQFAYPHLLGGGKPDWRHFYTSNLSVKTELLQRFPFDEVFPYAAMEDMELAYRIEKQFGLDLRFLPTAVAEHLHPTTFRQACRRTMRAGYSWRLFCERWPEHCPMRARTLRRILKLSIARNTRALSILTGAANLLTQVVCPNLLMKYVLDCHYQIGMESAPKTRVQTNAG